MWEGKDYREHLDKLNRAIENVKGGLSADLPENIGRCESPGLVILSSLCLLC